jgi:hypothetical protein
MSAMWILMTRIVLRLRRQKGDICGTQARASRLSGEERTALETVVLSLLLCSEQAILLPVM